MRETFPKRGIYAISPPFKQGSGYLEKIEASIKAGVVALQIREKKYLQTTSFIDLLKHIRKLCYEYNVNLIINDSVKIAKKLSCGVHLGKNDMNLVSARQQMGKNALIGISCYNSSLNAIKSAKQGANYVALGSFFSSKTKPHALNCKLSELQKLKGKLSIPIVAIGGITNSNAKLIVDNGADLVAVSSYIYSAIDPWNSVKTLQKIFNEAR